MKERLMSIGAGRENGEKGRRPGRLLTVFKAVVLLALAAVAAYAILKEGIYFEHLWLPVAQAFWCCSSSRSSCGASTKTCRRRGGS